MKSVKPNPDKHNTARLTTPPDRDGSADAALVSARVGRRSAKWALAYLRGRSAAYLRGSVTRGNVKGCVELALRYGASLDEVRRVLAEYALVWNAVRQDIEQESPAPESRATPVPTGTGLRTRGGRHERRDIQSTPEAPAPPVRRLA